MKKWEAVLSEYEALIYSNNGLDAAGAYDLLDEAKKLVAELARERRRNEVLNDTVRYWQSRSRPLVDKE